MGLEQMSTILLIAGIVFTLLFIVLLFLFKVPQKILESKRYRKTMERADEEEHTGYTNEKLKQEGARKKEEQVRSSSQSPPKPVEEKPRFDDEGLEETEPLLPPGYNEKDPDTIVLSGRPEMRKQEEPDEAPTSYLAGGTRIHKFKIIKKEVVTHTAS